MKSGSPRLKFIVRTVFKVSIMVNTVALKQPRTAVDRLDEKVRSFGQRLKIAELSSILFPILLYKNIPHKEHIRQPFQNEKTACDCTKKDAAAFSQSKELWILARRSSFQTTISDLGRTTGCEYQNPKVKPKHACARWEMSVHNVARVEDKIKQNLTSLCP